MTISVFVQLVSWGDKNQFRRSISSIISSINQLNFLFACKIINWLLTPESNGMSCAPSWTQPEDVPYNVFLFTFGFFLPLVLILLTSWIAISNIRRSCRSIESDDIKSSAMARQYKVVKMVTLCSTFLS